MNDFPDITTINKALALETIQQLEKDFALSGVSIQFERSKIMDYKSLKEEVELSITAFEKELGTTIDQLFYVIDLPQKKDLTKGDIIDQILFREFQKVIFRKMYSSK